MMRPAYNSPSVPITWPRLDFCSGTNEYVSVQPEAKQQILDFYKQDPVNAKKQFGDEPFELKNILKYWVRSKNSDMHFIPYRHRLCNNRQGGCEEERHDDGF